MCGIIAAFHKKERESVNTEILDIFEDQYHRGTEGFGIIGIDGNFKPSVLRSTEGAKFMFDLHKRDWHMMVVHHRTPTSTDNKIRQTHPILVSNKELPSDFLVVHNGVISNAKELWEAHEKLGYGYTTAIETRPGFIKWNDSEGLAVEASRFISGLSTQIAIEGSAAFIAVEIDKINGSVKQIHFGRNTNPLNMAATRGRIVLSSEGKGDPIKAMTLFSFNPKGDFALEKRKLTFKETTVKQLPAIVIKKYASDYKTWDQKEEERWERNFRGLEEERPIEGFTADKDTPPETEDLQLYNDMTDDVAIELEQFFEEINDPQTIEFADIEMYVKNFRNILENTKLSAIAAYEQYTTEEKQGKLPIDA